MAHWAPRRPREADLAMRPSASQRQYSTIACRAQQQPDASVVRLQLRGDFAEQPAEPGYGGLVAVFAVP